jgi:hypothetical protein
VLKHLKQHKQLGFELGLESSAAEFEYLNPLAVQDQYEMLYEVLLRVSVESAHQQ